MKRTLLLIAAACMAALVQAQVITWSVSPGTYTKIEPYWGDMFLVHNGNKTGVINGDGFEVIEPQSGRITGFYDSVALVLKSSQGKERVVGILSADGSYTEVDGTYYTIENQDFFSEGYLTVQTASGSCGYMNTNGQLVKEYQVLFVSPFSEGYAVVGEGGDSHNFSIIDSHFKEQQISLTSMSPLWNGTNVYEGVAIVWDGSGNIFEFRPRSGGPCTPVRDKVVKDILKKSDYNPDYDFLGSLAKLTNRPVNVSFDEPERPRTTLQASQKNGKFGYAKGQDIILPYQFEQAESFHGNYAIVKTNGKYALLALHQDDGEFQAKATNAEIKYQKGSGRNLTHKFAVTLPTVWNTRDVTVRVKDAEGITADITNNGNSYEFKDDGGNDKETRKYSVTLNSDGMLLWQGEITYSYSVEDVPPPPPAEKALSVVLKMVNKDADRNNRCYVNAVVSNPNATAVTATVSITGSNLLTAVKKTVTVPAHASTTVTTFFTLAKSVHRGKVSASTSKGGSASLDVQLIPFE